VDFLCGEFVDMIQKGQWILLPSKLLLNNRNLRLSPLGVVPQRDRRPRTICDYSFFLVNDGTIELCPEQSMQFGRALLRILQKIANSDPRLGLVYLSKIDIVDGFYRIAIRSNDVPKLAIMFPTAEGEEPLVGLPLFLPMGWKQSPPLFTAATETVADLANNKLTDMKPSVPHRLDLLSKTPIRFTPPPRWCLIKVLPPSPSPSRQRTDAAGKLNHALSNRRTFTSMTLSAWCKATAITVPVSNASCSALWMKSRAA
jgi:hypothetical protein